MQSGGLDVKRRAGCQAVSRMQSDEQACKAVSRHAKRRAGMQSGGLDAKRMNEALEIHTP
jgi:hypothetical protein